MKSRTSKSDYCTCSKLTGQDVAVLDGRDDESLGALDKLAAANHSVNTRRRLLQKPESFATSRPIVRR